MPAATVTSSALRIGGRGPSNWKRKLKRRSVKMVADIEDSVLND